VSPTWEVLKAKDGKINRVPGEKFCPLGSARKGVSALAQEREDLPWTRGRVFSWSRQYVKLGKRDGTVRGKAGASEHGWRESARARESDWSLDSGEESRMPCPYGGLDRSVGTKKKTMNNNTQFTEGLERWIWGGRPGNLTVSGAHSPSDTYGYTL